VAELWIDGTWVAPALGGIRTITCPADGSVVRSVSEASAIDTDRAVCAARAAFDHGEWPGTPVQDRAALLLRTAALLERDSAEYARAESLDTGKRLVESEYDLADVSACFRYFAALILAESGRVVDTGQAGVVSRIEAVPIGVCALITPWNYPLLQASWKIAPALAAGNTFVLKPSEFTPSTAILLMSTLAEAGLPNGVGNLILGAGPEAGAPLADDPGVDLVSFTGGVVTGRRIMAAAAATVKRVALELGGKNPNIVFADADLDAAIDGAVTAVFLHSGQVCSAGARLLVQDQVHDQVVDEIVRRAQLIRLGGPFDPDAETGPLISSAHRDKVDAYVQAGIAEGASLRCGGTAPSDPDLKGGWYFAPTVLTNCTASMSVVREESFGPVLTVERFTDEAEAIALGNDTIYGLAGAVWTQDPGRGQRVARALRHGTIWINDYHPYVPMAEWGGFKQSGIGRELGPSGLAEYRELKHIWQNINPQPQYWFGSGRPQERSDLRPSP